MLVDSSDVVVDIYGWDIKAPLATPPDIAILIWRSTPKQFFDPMHEFKGGNAETTHYRNVRFPPREQVNEFVDVVRVVEVIDFCMFPHATCFVDIDQCYGVFVRVTLTPRDSQYRGCRFTTSEFPCYVWCYINSLLKYQHR